MDRQRKASRAASAQASRKRRSTPSSHSSAAGGAADHPPQRIRYSQGRQALSWQVRRTALRGVYGRIWQKNRQQALTEAETASPLAARPYDLRHACVTTWHNVGVDPAQVAEWAGQSVAVLLRVYVRCIAGRDEIAKKRIERAFDEELRTNLANLAAGRSIETSAVAASSAIRGWLARTCRPTCSVGPRRSIERGMSFDSGRRRGNDQRRCLADVTRSFLSISQSGLQSFNWAQIIEVLRDAESFRRGSGLAQLGCGQDVVGQGCLSHASRKRSG